jgi:sugar-specific transcriptional regulator TrmB
MKYKQQALSKIEKLENQLKTLEMSIHRSFPANEVQKIIDNIKEIVDSIRGTISIENDEWN